jgi:hypothetical protein
MRTFASATMYRHRAEEYALRLPPSMLQVVDNRSWQSTAIQTHMVRICANNVGNLAQQATRVNGNTIRMALPVAAITFSRERARVITAKE